MVNQMFPFTNNRPTLLGAAWGHFICSVGEKIFLYERGGLSGLKTRGPIAGTLQPFSVLENGPSCVAFCGIEPHMLS